jgi:hypothetical protein
MELNPEVLVSHTWMLVNIADPTGVVPAIPAGDSRLRFEGGSAFDNHGNAAVARVDSGSITFGGWANHLVDPGNSPDLTVPQTRFFARGSRRSGQLAHRRPKADDRQPAARLTGVRPGR